METQNNTGREVGQKREINGCGRIAWLHREISERENGLSSGTIENPSLSIINEIQRLVQSEYKNSFVSDIRSELNERMARYIGAPVENIRLMPGKSLAVERIIKAFCRPGDNLLIGGPDSEDAALVAEKYGVSLRYYQGITPFSVDCDGLIGKAETNTKIIWLGYPDRLTGAVLSRSEIEYLLEMRPDSIVVLDESYYEYFGDTMVPLVRKYDNLLILRTFGAAMGLDTLPVSCAVANEETLQRIKKLSPSNTPPLFVMAAATAMLNKLDRIRMYSGAVRENMLYLSVRLRRSGVSNRMTIGDRLLVRVNHPPGVLSYLKKAGIRAAGMGRFRQLENYISLIITGDSSMNAVIMETFEKIPAQYYRIQHPGQTRFTLHRTETKQSELIKSGTKPEVE